MAKYTIDLGTDYDKQLGEVAKSKGMTKADIVRRALATYMAVNIELKNGSKLAFTDEQGKVIKELITV